VASGVNGFGEADESRDTALAAWWEFKVVGAAASDVLLIDSAASTRKNVCVPDVVACEV
jgi:hypothetical protein